ncbi:MAG: hypothetical protein E7050_05360 [Lentisphaerae bacterium]|nr:hypothetical protein [Lentisphaerota bacterium]
MASGKNIQSVFDLEMVKNCTEQLYSYEKSCSHTDFVSAAEYCCRALDNAGFENIELLKHDADGRTSAFDCTMPPAWDLVGRSYLSIAGENIILADSDQTPFAVAPWSASTPPGGITGELVALAPGEMGDVRNKWVLLTIDDGRNPHGEYLEKLCENGAIGVVAADFLAGKDYPESVRWFNGTGRFGWYPQAEDRRLPLFGITAEKGRMLLDRLAAGKVLLHGVANTRSYAGKIFTVTAVIPGISREEYALFSHIYEPFAADNAFGFGAICAIGKAIKEVYGKPEKTLRVVFSMELYGFAAFLADPARSALISGALNMDAVNHRKQRLLAFMYSPVCNPWFGDWVISGVLQEQIADTSFVQLPGILSDDTFAGDPLCGGIPVNWCKNPSGTAHHCGCDDFEVDWQWAAEELPAFAAAIAAMLQISADEAAEFPALAAAEFKEQSSLILSSAKTSAEKSLLLKELYKYLKGKLSSAEKYCNTTLDKTGLDELLNKSIAGVSGELHCPDVEITAGRIIPVRKKSTPFSLADIPYCERKSFRVSRLLYSLFDGTRSLLDAFRLADWVLNTSSSHADIENEIRRLKYLEKYGYVKIIQSNLLK